MVGCLLEPVAFDLFEGLALGFEDEQPDEEEQHRAEQAVEPEGQRAMERREQPGVLVHHREGLGDDVIGDPQADGGDGHGPAANPRGGGGVCELLESCLCGNGKRGAAGRGSGPEMPT